MFVVEDSINGKEYIVKFAKRYGKDVHVYCANAGFTPALLYHEILPSGWIFVFMEKLSLILIDQSNDRPAARDQLLQIQTTLNNESFVHGDLREGNVMWVPASSLVVLIDAGIDWTGRDGKTTYPPFKYPTFMNPEIAWPHGAETGKLMRIAHDAQWLKAISATL